MIDRLREQIQERLEQLTGEADRLRRALAALEPADVDGAGAQAACAREGQSTRPDGQSDEERAGPAGRARLRLAPLVGRRLARPRRRCSPRSSEATR